MEGERPLMRAARYHGPGTSLLLETVPVPRPGPGEALVHVEAAGVCHTELQLLAGTLNLGVAPLTLGHEVAGAVADVGEGVSGVVPGDRVAVYYYVPCGECGWCRGGQEQICPNLGPQVGLSGDGGFAEYLRVSARSLLSIPDGVDAAAAATLGCSAATALHALRAVAEVRAGESVLIWGVGAVGMALIQLARRAGATVFAVGRSPAKLACARDLGADVTVNAREQDVVSEVLRATRSEGVDVAFELVGSRETMAGSLAALRRRGRLVFVGYGEDRLVVNPLHLVLKELQVRGSVGNTREELRETLQLAQRGELRSVVDGYLPLERVNEAIQALREGRVVGRVVLDPALAAADGPRVGHWASSEDRASAEMAPASPFGTTAPPNPLPAAGRENRLPDATLPGSAISPPRVGKGLGAGSSGGEGLSMGSAWPDDGSSPNGSGDPPSPGFPTQGAGVYPAEAPPLEAELLALIGRGVDAPRDDREFGDLALKLFGYQFERNGPYRAFCERRGHGPQTVSDWREIPAVPIAAFKEARLACEPIEGAREFNSSGTTRPERKSRHYHPSLAVYDLSATLNFRAHVLPDDARLPIYVLFPPPDEMPNSSLAYWLALMARRFDPDGGRWFVGQDGLDVPALAGALREAERTGRPACLLAASFALVHFLDACAADGRRFALPRGSRLMDTGGYKGKSRELSKDELYRLVRDTLGLPHDALVNMYGMTEHSTQFLDAVLRNRIREVTAPRYKTVPPWARTRVLDPDTLRPVPPGQPGLLCHYDLANRASVLAVLSEDVGYELGDGFELIGRAAGTEARGCSIAVDELIAAARGG